MKFQLFLIAVVLGTSLAKRQQRTDTTTEYPSDSNGNDYDSTTLTGDEDEFGTVGTCTRTNLNIDVQEIDYAWCIQDLAKYIRSVTVEKFLTSEMKLSNTLEFDYALLPGTWGFELKTNRNNTMGNYLEIKVYYNTTEPDVVIRPDLLLKADDKSSPPCFQESNTVVKTEDKAYNTYQYDYNSFIRTTRPPPQMFYSYQTKFVFSAWKLNQLLLSVDEFASANPRKSRTRSEISDDHLDLIFKITTAKKGSAFQSTLDTSCNEPNYRAVQKMQRLKDEKDSSFLDNVWNSTSGSDFVGNTRSPSNAGASSGYYYGGGKDTLVPARYSYSTPRHPI